MKSLLAALLALASPAFAAPPSAPPAAASPPASTDARRAIALADLDRVRSVSDPQRSPDGQWVAYVVGTSDAEKDTRDSDLWMVDADGQRQVRLTSSPDSESTPRWSPDGRYLGFVTARGDEAEKKKGGQVWLLDRAGGEAVKLTDVQGGVSDFAWSPDSRRLVLVVNDPNPADDPEKLEGWKRKTKPPIVVDRYHFKQDRDGYLGNLHSHLALFDVASHELTPLAAGPYDDSAPAWSPDGAAIVFVSARGDDPDRGENSDLWVVDAKAGATPRQLTTYTGADEGRPQWSPDGRWIAYLQADDPRLTVYSQDVLAIVPAAGGAPRLLTASLDRPVSSPRWSADGQSLYFVFEDDRTQVLGRVSASGGAIERLTSGPRVVETIAGGGGIRSAVYSAGDHSRLSDGGSRTHEPLAVVAGSDTQPGEVHAFAGGALRRLTHQNEEWLRDIELTPSEDVAFRAQDGTDVHALLTRPRDCAAGRRCPLVLDIHGGPNGQDAHDFDFSRQLYVANGYAVLQVNYRGSSGRGAAHQRAIWGDWGNKEVVDLLAAVDWAIAAGVADPQRLGLGGWSYGGILTNYLIASDPRFKAAVSGAGSSLQTTMYGVDQYIVQYDNELGPPWKNPAIWTKVSYPFFHADRIRTPTLFMGGEKDFNVPLVGSEQMYQALKSLGRDTELVIYPDQFHGLTTPSYRRDRLARWLAWWGKYLGPTPTPATNKTGP